MARVALGLPDEAGVASTISRPMGMLTKKTHRQSSHSTRMPPASSPIALPPADTAANTPNARLRSGPSRKVVVMRDSAVGEAMAPPTPWSDRAASNCQESWESPPSRDANTKSRTPNMNMRRRPRMSPDRPPSSSRPPKVSVYALMTQDRFSVENPRAVWMCGSAMFTMVMSRTTINWHEAMTRRAMPLPLPRCGESADSEDVT